MFFKKSDIIVTLTIICICVLLWAIYKNGFLGTAKAEIYYYSELALTVSLYKGEEKTFTIPQNENVIFRLSEDGSISFTQSDCPDKVCINSGRLNTVGQYAACLPNGIIVKIVPEHNRGDDDLDIIVGE